MWMPKTEIEIINVVNSGSLEESSTFDAKQSIPSRNHETAKDIAAMATDGGAIIYGIGEDENGNPTVLTPIVLADQIERITAIANTSIQEPPDIVIWSIPTDGDDSKGYVLVFVPPSERAPHMVVVNNINRYYGRSGKQNVRLDEGGVARLYERRQKMELKLDNLLYEMVQNTPVMPTPAYGFLHLIAAPVFKKEGFLDRIVREGVSIDNVLHSLVEIARDDSVSPRNYFSPDFDDNFPDRWVRDIDGLKGNLACSASSSEPLAPRYALILHFNFDGSLSLFSGRISEKINSDMRLFPSAIAGLTKRFIALTSSLYEQADYFGMVDIGVAITGVKGAITLDRRGRERGYRYEHKDYRRTVRVSALVLKDDPLLAARRLVNRFFETLFQGLHDPLAG